MKSPNAIEIYKNLFLKLSSQAALNILKYGNEDLIIKSYYLDNNFKSYILYNFLLGYLNKL